MTAAGAFTDAANAGRFVKLFQDMARFNANRRKWLIWDGKRWATDERGKVMEMAEQTSRGILQEAAAEQDGDQAAKLAKWGAASLDKPQLVNMLMLAQHKLAIVMEELDRDSYLLNCQNGTLDLRTGELRGHRRTDLITRIVNADYNPAAKCPTWDAFLNRVMLENSEMVRFLQRCIGYSLTGTTKEQCLFICHGNGANGKSTFLETNKRLLGDDYAAGTPSESILSRHFDGGIPNDLARLKGARFVTINEIQQGRRMDEPKVKAMTGGDTLTARFLHGEFFDFVPEFKLWIRANHKPEITGTDNAIWRRVRLIPFEVEIPPAEQDPDLLDKLRGEWDGIPRWAVEVCLLWQQDRLNPPETVTQATAGYREEMDTLQHFLDERTELADGFLPFKTLYAVYTAWCDETGERPMKQKQLSQAMTERGYEPARAGRDGSRGFRGIVATSKVETLTLSEVEA